MQVLRSRDIMRLPASRYNRKEELSAEELANHPILLRKSRLWDCIPGRVQTMDDNMSGACDTRVSPMSFLVWIPKLTFHGYL
jgi:hypothetical protein